jgi:type VI protein secretion system component Hcp
MKTTQQTFESATATDSNNLIELDEPSLSQVAGGVSLNYAQIQWEYRQQH